MKTTTLRVTLKELDLVIFYIIVYVAAPFWTMS